MLRLLWKEWHEVKWYLIGLIAGPWLLTLWPSSNLGYTYGYGVEAWDVQVLMLILAFWAATRMPGEMKANRLTARSLPVDPWLLGAVKFLPGLAVAILLPYWIHLVAAVRVPEAWAFASSQSWHTPTETFDEITWLSLSLYTVSFAVSMLASSMAAVLVAWLAVVIGAPIAAYHLVAYICMYVHIECHDFLQVADDELARGVLSGAALIAAAAVWAKVGTSGARRKWEVAAISAALALPIVMLAACLCLAVTMGNTWYIKPVVMSQIERYRERKLLSEDDIVWHPHLVSKDRKLIAYVDIVTRRQREKCPRDRRSLHPMDYVRVRDARGTRTVMCRVHAAPMAWLPDDNLLLVAGRSNKYLDLIEWNRESGRITPLASFPKRTPILTVVPRNDGAKIALFTVPLSGTGIDLWMLDRKTRKLKLLRPGLGMSTWDDVRAGWLGDRLIFQKWSSKYWSIRSDGSDLRPVFEPGSGNHG